MKILAIGDPHGSEKIRKIPFENIDLILLPGDIGKCDLARKYAFKKVTDTKYTPSDKQKKEAYMESYNSTIKTLKFLSKKAPVYFVYGNLEQKDSEIKKLSKEIKFKLPLLGKSINKIKNVHIVNNKIVKLKGLTLAGNDYFIETDWVKKFDSNNLEKLKLAKKETKRAKKFYSKLRKVDILLCHQPPHNLLDKVTAKFAPKSWRGKHAGSKLILSYIKRKHPKFVICGHIHEANGKKKIGETNIINLGAYGKYLLINFD